MQVLEAQEVKNHFNIAIVVSQFNTDVTQKLYEGALARLKELEFSDEQITVVWVPGAVEIPVVAQRLARPACYEAIVCLSAIIRGETSHYDYVCDQVSQGCQRVSLDYDVPVIFGVLTTENMAQAFDRLGGSHGHKGKEAVDAACDMVSIMRQLAQ